jgi:hypothetical protein
MVEFPQDLIFTLSNLRDGLFDRVDLLAISIRPRLIISGNGSNEAHYVA